MNQNHLTMLIWLDEQTKQFSEFSATKQRVINELVTKGLVRIEANNYPLLEPKGKYLLESTINLFNSLVQE